MRFQRVSAWHRQVNELRSERLLCIGVSEGRRNAGHLTPRHKGLRSGCAMVTCIDVGRTTEEVCHLIVNLEKTLGLTGRFEALHDALASSGRLMTVLRAVV